MVKRVGTAKDTVRIMEEGSYTNKKGLLIEVGSNIKNCVEKTICYEPVMGFNVKEEVLMQDKRFETTEFELRDETTLEASRFLSEKYPESRIGVLNFASAKNPGGGFLKGAQAQEESLARSSALYQSLLEGRKYYDHHRSLNTCIYSDHMIYSPRCPVFRKDNGDLLDNYYMVDFITSPAPNAGAVTRNEPENADKIEDALYQRGAKLLSIYAYHKCDIIVLGAWGCGVFMNNPAMVSGMFYSYLTNDFSGRFKKVVFAVKSSAAKTYREFEKRFGS